MQRDYLELKSLFNELDTDQEDAVAVAVLMQLLDCWKSRACAAAEDCQQVLREKDPEQRLSFMRFLQLLYPHISYADLQSSVERYEQRDTNFLNGKDMSMDSIRKVFEEYDVHGIGKVCVPDCQAASCAGMLPLGEGQKGGVEAGSRRTWG